MASTSAAASKDLENTQRDLSSGSLTATINTSSLVKSKTTTAACGTTRDTATWHHVKGASPITKKSWHEAAKDLYAAFQVEAA